MKRKLILLGLLALSVTFNACGTETKAEVIAEIPTETVSTETISVETTQTPMELGTYEYGNKYYVLCEVTECNMETFTIVAPDGSLQEFYMIEDYPIDDNGNPIMKTVLFKVLKSAYEDYNAWIVIDVID